MLWRRLLFFGNNQPLSLIGTILKVAECCRYVPIYSEIAARVFRSACSSDCYCSESKNLLEAKQELLKDSLFSYEMLNLSTLYQKRACSDACYFPKYRGLDSSLGSIQCVKDYVGMHIEEEECSRRKPWPLERSPCF